MYNLFRFEVTPGKESVKSLARYCFVWNNHFAPVRKKIASSASPPSFPLIFFDMGKKIKRQP